MTGAGRALGRDDARREEAAAAARGSPVESRDGDGAGDGAPLLDGGGAGVPMSESVLLSDVDGDGFVNVYDGLEASVVTGTRVCERRVSCPPRRMLAQRVRPR